MAERPDWEEEEDWIGLTAAGCPENNVGSISVWFPASCERLLSEKNEKHHLAVRSRVSVDPNAHLSQTRRW